MFSFIMSKNKDFQLIQGYAFQFAKFCTIIYFLKIQGKRCWLQKTMEMKKRYECISHYSKDV